MSPWLRQSIIAAAVLVCLPPAAIAQVLQINTLRIPRGDAAEFLQLYNEIANAMERGERGVDRGVTLLAHRYAGNYSFMEITQYDSLTTLNRDFNSGNRRWRAFLETLPDSAARAPWREKRQKVNSYVLEGHTDEVRNVNTTIGFSNMGTDGAHDNHSHIVSVGYYTPKWSDMAEFIRLYGAGNMADDRSSGHVMASWLTTHTTGSGPTIEVFTVYEDWAAFAASEAIPVPVANGAQPDATIWRITPNHWDAILVTVGSSRRLADGTSTFQLYTSR